MIEEYANQTITRIRMEPADKWGRKSPAANAEYIARVKREERKLRDASGNDIQSNYRIWLAPNADIRIGDSVYIGQINTDNAAEPRGYPVIQKLEVVGWEIEEIEVLC